jgi:hypothetical protein
MDIMTYGALQGKASIKSPHLKGAPTAPNPRIENDSKRIATTSFVHEVVGREVMDARNYGYDLAPGNFITIPVTQAFITIGDETGTEAGIACLVHPQGNITYFNTNNSLASIEIENDKLTITNLNQNHITVVIFLYSIYYPIPRLKESNED